MVDHVLISKPVFASGEKLWEMSSYNSTKDNRNGIRTGFKNNISQSSHRRRPRSWKQVARFPDIQDNRGEP